MKKLYFCGVEKKGGIVMVGDLADPVLRRMLSECFGDGNGKQRRCVMAFFSRCREAVEGFENVNLKGVGMMQPKYLLAWRRYLRGLQALKDVDYIGRKCVEELEDLNRGDEYVREMVTRYKLEKYYDK